MEGQRVVFEIFVRPKHQLLTFFRRFDMAATPTGNVSVVDVHNTVLASGALDTSGNADLNWQSNEVGDLVFTVNYSGDTNYNPFSSPPIPFTITSVKSNVTVNVSVSPASPQPEGTSIQFMIGVVPTP